LTTDLHIPRVIFQNAIYKCQINSNEQFSNTQEFDVYFLGTDYYLSFEDSELQYSLEDLSLNPLPTAGRLSLLRRGKQGEVILPIVISFHCYYMPARFNRDCSKIETFEGLDQKPNIIFGKNLSGLLFIDLQNSLDYFAMHI
jgi:hypothetical protein